ncbi:MAG: hydrogenase 4 subunit B [Chloroflexota bacterium]|nr:hydrogenase 4 subunit B [Chloroflexota bacterium]
MLNRELTAAMLAPAAIYLVGAALALIVRHDRGRAAHVVALIGSGVGAVIAVRALLNGTTEQLHLWAVTPFANLNVRLDPLSAFFLLVISLIAIPVSLYAVGYLADEPGPTALLGVAYNVFLAAMVLVVIADSVFMFLIAWEAMSLASYLLVMHNHREREVQRAGFVYLVMTHLGTAFLMAAFLVLFLVAGSSSLDFAAFRVAAAHLSETNQTIIFLLALVGFGTKAGIIPLHIWLPRAHPAAPSHVSALMSGVMIKTAIYGLVRIGWEFAGPGPVWWGALVLALGIVSAVLGVLYALLEDDMKRLLAYSSVENIGIILIGVGTAFMLQSLGHPVAAALALIAGFYHLLNHAVFKSLLFLGGGAIHHATHTRSMEKLGGLIRRMPWTAATFLVGAAAIAAILPFNGFISEWLTLQSLLQLGITESGLLSAAIVGVAAGALALTGGLAVFTFIKAFGVMFLGVPRSDHATNAQEVRLTMRIGMLFLALCCIVLGLVPALALRLLRPVTTALTGSVAQPHFRLIPQARHDPALAQHGSYAPLALLALLVLAGGLVYLLARALGGPVRRRIAPPWVCGGVLEPAMQYTAAALTKSARIIFRMDVRRERGEGITYAQAPYFVASVRYEERMHPVYERYLYRPAVHALIRFAEAIRRLQNGRLRRYLAYQFAALVIVLLLTR